MPDPAPLPLILVGGVHGDRHGFRRTLHFLETFQPDLVLVELSPFGKSFRDRNRRTLQQTFAHNLLLAARHVHLSLREALLHPEIKVIRRQLALPFEYRAARRFVRNTGNRLALVDSSLFSRRMIAHWPELISSSNLSSLLLLAPDTRPTSAQTYERAAQLICQELTPPAFTGEWRWQTSDALWQRREQFLATRIRSTLRETAPWRATYLGGWQHLTGAGPSPTLRELLGLDRNSCWLLDRGFLQSS